MNTNTAVRASPGIAVAMALALGLAPAFRLPALATAFSGGAEAAGAAAAASYAAANAAGSAAAIAEGAAEGTIAEAAATAAAEAAAEANDAAWEAAEAANTAQTATQEALMAARSGNLAAAEAANAQAAQAAARAEAAALDANGAAIEADIAGVNPSGASKNCGYVVQAVEDRFAGDAVSYADPNGLLSNSDIASNLRGTWQTTTEHGISSALQAAGDGARGVIKIEWAGESITHVVNVIQRGGTTFFVDGQSGRVATSVGELIPRVSINGLEWIPTFP